MLIANWHRTLTHSYAAWCTYAAIGIHFAQESLPYVGEIVPWYASVGVLAAGLLLRLVKQKSVSGEDDDEQD